MHSKGWKLVEYNFSELETAEAKMDSNPTIVETADTQAVKSLSLIIHLLPLTDSFFNPSFSLLPDLLFYNTPQLFL